MAVFQASGLFGLGECSCPCGRRGLSGQIFGWELRGVGIRTQIPRSSSQDGWHRPPETSTRVFQKSFTTQLEPSEFFLICLILSTEKTLEKIQPPFFNGVNIRLRMKLQINIDCILHLLPHTHTREE